jgi:hypothetical protein
VGIGREIEVESTGRWVPRVGEVGRMVGNMPPQFCLRDSMVELSKNLSKEDGMLMLGDDRRSRRSGLFDDGKFLGLSLSFALLKKCSSRNEKNFLLILKPC